MGKLFSWVAIAFAIYVAYKIVLALQRKARLRAEQEPDVASRNASTPEPAQTKRLTTLIACAHCGLQLPKDEAVDLKGDYFCGEPHARLGVKAAGKV